MRNIVVIGGSTGASDVIKPLLAGLPQDFGGSVFVSTHVPAEGLRALGAVLATHSRLPVSYPEDGETVRPGHVYLPTPDRHLLLVGGVMRHGFGPRENMVRPSIDPLFRSAAATYGPRAVGVILTGMLSDGASGLEAVARCGGATVVQDPETALAPDMPLAACRAVTPDYLAPPERLAEVIAGLAREPAPPGPSAPEDLRFEIEIALGRRLGSARLERLADPAPLVCPDCQGVLSQVRQAPPLRFRCQTGHAFNADVLFGAQDDKVEEALRIALRVVEERVDLVSRIADDARRTGRNSVASMYESRHREYANYATTLREAAISMMRDADEPEKD